MLQTHPGHDGRGQNGESAKNRTQENPPPARGNLRGENPESSRQSDEQRIHEGKPDARENPGSAKAVFPDQRGV